jgi:hypothetical protein
MECIVRGGHVCRFRIGARLGDARNGSDAAIADRDKADS